jgi:hypothetical protein
MDAAPSGKANLPRYWDDPTPLHYFDCWPLEGLGSASRSQIKARLLKVHAEFLENQTGELPEIHCWRRAYDVFAIQFEEASLLTEDIIRKTIPAMVADAGVSGRWTFGRFSSIMPSGDRAQRLGQEYYHPDRIRLFFKFIEGRIVEWSGKLDLQHSKEDGGAQRLSEPNDDSETLTSGETESPDAHRAPVILFEQSKTSGARADPGQRPELVPANTQARVPLRDELKNASARTADPKLLKKLVAVVRYQHYFEDLKVLKAACKRYQTPALLDQQFPDLDVWSVMDSSDKADIAKGAFVPGHFAWALVMRLNNLNGNDNRTLKNYRKALKAAGLG